MIDLDELERALDSMKPRSKLYECVRKALQRQGRWLNKPRGNNPAPAARRGKRRSFAPVDR